MTTRRVTIADRHQVVIVDDGSTVTAHLDGESCRIDAVLYRDALDPALFDATDNALEDLVHRALARAHILVEDIYGDWETAASAAAAEAEDDAREAERRAYESSRL